MGIAVYFAGNDYIPTRQEIRRHLESAFDHVDDMIADGELSPDKRDRFAWSGAVRAARFYHNFAELRGRYVQRRVTD
jgi:hypothetical protein